MTNVTLYNSPFEVEKWNRSYVRELFIELFWSSKQTDLLSTLNSQITMKTRQNVPEETWLMWI